MMWGEFGQFRRRVVNVLGLDLRTPLTYSGAQAELALENVSSVAPENQEGFL